jgi:conjugal transfer/entry exclusion protein
LKSKVRYVDPKVLFEKEVKRVSEVDKEFKQKIKDFIDRKSKGFYVKIESNSEFQSRLTF